MQIFVFEYITGGGFLGRDLPRALVEEGEMVLASLVSDLAEIDGVDVLIIRDARLPIPELPARYRIVRNSLDFINTWKSCLESADAVWPIAPEFNQILEGVSDHIVKAGKVLLNCPPEALQYASSKISTIRHLAKHGIDTVPTYRPDQGVPKQAGMWVIKPDDGVGCQEISICPDTDALCAELGLLPANRSYVVQPYVRGRAVSLSILAKNGDALLLSVNHQQMAVTDSAFILLGLVVNGLNEGVEQYRRIAQSISSAIPSLWGLIGIDLITTEEGPKVLEINPRLTRSYVGLKESIGVNPAKMVLDLALGHPLPTHSVSGKAVNVDFDYMGGWSS